MSYLYRNRESCGKVIIIAVHPWTAIFDERGDVFTCASRSSVWGSRMFVGLLFVVKLQKELF